VLILIFFNKVLHIRASGHGCSVTGPLVLLIYFIGPVVILPCIMLACAVVWSSVLLKRHKPSDLAFGGLSVIISCAILLLIGLLIR
jgi:membrane-associated phospholipid phosphatase